MHRLSLLYADAYKLLFQHAYIKNGYELTGGYELTSLYNIHMYVKFKNLR